MTKRSSSERRARWGESSVGTTGRRVSAAKKRARRGAVGGKGRTPAAPKLRHAVDPKGRRRSGAAAEASPVAPEGFVPLDPKDAEAARLRGIVSHIDVRLALELEGLIDHALTEFERTAGAVVAKACSIPGDKPLPLRSLVHCAFLGHILARMERADGRLPTERVVAALLDQFERARQEVGALVGPGA